MSNIKAERYAAYKDSGAAWVGEIPKHWSLLRFKDFTEILSGYSPEEVKPDLYGDTAYYKVDDLNFLSESGHIMQSTWFTNYKKNIQNKNILLLPKRGMSILTNKTGITNVSCVFDTNLMGLRLSNKHVDIKFIFYWIINTGLSKLADITTIPQLNNKHIYPLTIPLPKKVEQTAIAAYLDTKTAQIDRQIDLLGQKATQYGKLKQSLINETVTRGLDKSVPMKDSGVEWIGEVPAHWEIQRIKEVCDINKNTLTEKTPASYEFDYVDIGSVTYGEREFTKERMTFGTAPSRAKRIVKKGDTIISTVRTYLKAIATVDTEAVDLIVSTGFAVISPRKKIADRYCSYLLTSNCIVDEICARSNGVSYPATNATVIGDLFFLIPPLSEQVSIGAYLDEKTAQIDRIVTTINSQIDRLKDLRKALINDVVTGKIKVV